MIDGSSSIYEVELTVQSAFNILMAMKYIIFRLLVFVTLSWNLALSNNVEITNLKVSTKNDDKIEVLLSEFDKTSINNVFNLKEEFSDVKVSISFSFLMLKIVFKASFL